MSHQNKIQEITNTLEKKVINISPGDFRFYNIAHLPLIAKKTAENSDQCEYCKKNLETIETLVNDLSDFLSDDMNKRKIFESKKGKIEQHLKKDHKLHLPGYYAAMGSFIGLCIGVLAVFLLMFLYQTNFFNKLNLLTLTVFLITGRLTGLFIDKNIFKKNMQL